MLWALHFSCSESASKKREETGKTSSFKAILKELMSLFWYNKK